MEIKGLNEFQKSLEDMSKEIEELENKLDVSFDKLFNESFMQQYTSYKTWNELLSKSGFGVKNDEDFKKIPNKKLNRYIRKVTSFKNWEDMLNKATEIYMYKQIGI
ncbi:hypothetical protein [Clostridium kluyveri]|uniref:Uncharacterized protein n=2 Tax=Clostridium kluyveri TaxID=1534 RepID=A5N5H7_CLOK5|nr:hypothetical protein [Clostridium kluyveri]EDK32558.1 Conserved hypothetical protein [Clostridium kluyveri DSM 555]